MRAMQFEGVPTRDAARRKSGTTPRTRSGVGGGVGVPAWVALVAHHALRRLPPPLAPQRTHQIVLRRHSATSWAQRILVGGAGQSLSITGRCLDRWIFRSRLTLKLVPRPYTCPLSCSKVAKGTLLVVVPSLRVLMTAFIVIWTSIRFSGSCCEAALDRQNEPAILAKGG